MYEHVKTGCKHIPLSEQALQFQSRYFLNKPHICGKVNNYVTDCDWKETNGDNDIQTTFIFQRNLHTNLNTCPTVSQVPGNLRHKILVVAVGTTCTLLFQPCHSKESVPLKDVVFEGQTSGSCLGRGLGCKVDFGGLPTWMTSASLLSDWHYEDGHCHAAATPLAWHPAGAHFVEA